MIMILFVVVSAFSCSLKYALPPDQKNSMPIIVIMIIIIIVMSLMETSLDY